MQCSHDSPPLCHVDGFGDPGDLIDEGDSSSDVVDDRDVSDLLPRHRHVLQQLQNSMRHVLQRSVEREKGRGVGNYKRVNLYKFSC